MEYKKNEEQALKEIIEKINNLPDKEKLPSGLEIEQNAGIPYSVIKTWSKEAQENFSNFREDLTNCQCEKCKKIKDNK